MVLGTPNLTPTIILLTSTGFMLMELLINIKIILQALRIEKKENKKLIKKITSRQKSTWKKKNRNYNKEV